MMLLEHPTQAVVPAAGHEPVRIGAPGEETQPGMEDDLRPLAERIDGGARKDAVGGAVFYSRLPGGAVALRIGRRRHLPEGVAGDRAAEIDVVVDAVGLRDDVRHRSGGGVVDVTDG